MNFLFQPRYAMASWSDDQLPSKSCTLRIHSVHEKKFSSSLPSVESQDLVLSIHPMLPPVVIVLSLLVLQVAKDIIA